MGALLTILSRCRWLRRAFAITLFFCLVQSAHDGLVKRNRAFDPQRWWYPIYKLSSRRSRQPATFT